MCSLEISVVLSTFERPGHLARSLASLAAQEQVERQFEVIVTDDGSRDHTPEVVARFAASAPMPVKFVTQEHLGFRLARSRNNGIREAQAPYLLFTDGDCIFPPDHLHRHLAARQQGVVRAGDCVLLDRSTSESIGVEQLAAAWQQAIPRLPRRRIGRLHRKALFYQLIRHRKKPKLVGNNIGVWRSQLERVNGFDEQFRGWGCEDDDLAARLRQSGEAIRSVLGHTHAYHLWHPPHASTPDRWSDGVNVGYLHRQTSLTQCLSGLRARDVRELTATVFAQGRLERLAKKLRREFSGNAATPEVALLLGASAANGKLGALAERRIAIVGDGDRLAPRTLRSYDGVIRLAGLSRTPDAILASLDRVLRGPSSASEGSSRAA